MRCHAPDGNRGWLAQHVVWQWVWVSHPGTWQQTGHLWLSLPTTALTHCASHAGGCCRNPNVLHGRDSPETRVRHMCLAWRGSYLSGWQFRCSLANTDWAVERTSSLFEVLLSCVNRRFCCWVVALLQPLRPLPVSWLLQRNKHETALFCGCGTYGHHPGGAALPEPSLFMLDTTSCKETVRPNEERKNGLWPPPAKLFPNRSCLANFPSCWLPIDIKANEIDPSSLMSPRWVEWCHLLGGNCNHWRGVARDAARGREGGLSQKPAPTPFFFHAYVRAATRQFPCLVVEPKQPRQRRYY